MSTYKLTTPVEYPPGAMFTEFAIPAHLTGKDLRAMSAGKGEEDKMVRLVASVAGLPLPIADRMDARDILGAAELLGPLLEASAGRTGAD
jgi:hypothetical protein